MTYSIFSLPDDVYTNLWTRYNLSGKDLARIRCTAVFFRQLMNAEFCFVFYLESCAKNAVVFSAPELIHLYCLPVCPQNKHTLFLLNELCAHLTNADIYRVVKNIPVRPLRYDTAVSSPSKDENEAKTIFFWICYLLKTKMYYVLNKMLNTLARVIGYSYITDLPHSSLGDDESVYWNVYSILDAVCRKNGNFLKNHVDLVVDIYFNYLEHAPRSLVAPSKILFNSYKYPRAFKQVYKKLESKHIDIIVRAIENHPNTLLVDVGFKFLSKTPGLAYDRAVTLFAQINTPQVLRKKDAWRYATRMVCKTRREVSLDVFESILRAFEPSSGDKVTDNAIHVARTLLRHQTLSAERLAIFAVKFFIFNDWHNAIDKDNFFLYELVVHKFKKNAVIKEFLRLTYELVATTNFSARDIFLRKFKIKHNNYCIL